MSQNITFEESKSPEFRAIYTTGVFGGIRPDDAYMILFLDRVQTISSNDGNQTMNKINREAQAEIHMSPAQFKRIALWMQNHVKQYEQDFGTIAMEPKAKEVQSSGESGSHAK